MDLGDLSDIFAKAKPNALPLDVMAQQQALSRRQKVADMLTGLAFQQSPTQMVGQVAVRQSPFEAIAKTVAGGLAGNKQKGIDDEMLKISQDYLTRQREAIADALAKPTEQERTTAMLLRPDLPEIYAQGSKQQKELMQRGTKFGEEAIKGQSNQGKQLSAMTGNVAAGAGSTLTDPTEQLDPKKIAFDRSTGKPMAGLDQSIVQMRGPNGQMMNYNKQTGDMWAADSAPKVNVGVNVQQKAEGKFAEKTGEFSAEGFKAFHNEAKTHDNMVRSLDRMQRLSGTAGSGPLATFTNSLRELGQSIGLPVDEQRLASDAGYQSAFAGEIANYLTSGGGVGRSLTDADRQKIEQQYPQLVQTPQGRQQIFNDLRARAYGKRSLYAARMAELEKEYPEIAKVARIGMPIPDQQVPGSAPAPQPGNGKVLNWKDVPGVRPR